MIVGHIANVAEEGKFYPGLLQKGLAYLQSTDFSQMAEGKYTIEGDRIFATFSEYFPEEKEKRRAETHERYIDIQYMVDGEETIGFSRLSDHAEISEAYSAEKDITFYSSVEKEGAITLSQGMYVIFFPWDIHRPCCISQPGVKVRKVVIKLLAQDLL